MRAINEDDVKRLIRAEKRNWTLTQFPGVTEALNHVEGGLVGIRTVDSQIPRWISVEERLPEGEVIAANFAPGTYGYKEYLLGYVHKHDDLYYAENSFEILNTVTHWMPIPQPTKE